MSSRNAYLFGKLKAYTKRFKTDSLDVNYNGVGVFCVHRFNNNDVLLYIEGSMKLLWATIKDNNQHKIVPLCLLNGKSKDIIQNIPQENEYQYLMDNMYFLVGYDITNNQPLYTWDEFLNQQKEIIIWK